MVSESIISLLTEIDTDLGFFLTVIEVLSGEDEELLS